MGVVQMNSNPLAKDFNTGSLLKFAFPTISSAVDGNVNSIEKILAFYDPYISKCCLRPFYDRYGNVCIVVDMELKGRIREALIKMILDFDISLETDITLWKL